MVFRWTRPSRPFLPSPLLPLTMGCLVTGRNLDQKLVGLVLLGLGGTERGEGHEIVKRCPSVVVPVQNKKCAQVGEVQLVQEGHITYADLAMRYAIKSCNHSKTS